MNKDNLLGQDKGQGQIRILSYFRENIDFVATILDGLKGFAVTAYDFDGNIIDCNEGTIQIYGYSYEEIICRRTIEIFFPEDFVAAGRHQEIINNLFEKERFSYEGERIRKNGERFPVSVVTMLARKKDGSVAGFVEIVEDITERKRAEDKIRQQVDELERFKKATIQRELRMKDLKDKLKELKKE